MTILDGGRAGLNKVKPNFKHSLARNNQLFENHALTFCYVLNYTKFCILKNVYTTVNLKSVNHIVEFGVFF